MLNKVNPTKAQAWKKLTDHYEKINNIHMKDLFAADPERFSKFSIRLNDILIDYSKNRITEQTLGLLMDLAEECGLADAVQKMFSGDRINATENRAVLHVALRNRSNKPIALDGRDVMPDVNRVLEQMRQFSGNVATGRWRGYSGEPIRDIVNIGAGTRCKFCGMLHFCYLERCGACKKPMHYNLAKTEEVV